MKSANGYTGKPSVEMQTVLEALCVEDRNMVDPTLLPPDQGRELAAKANQRWNKNLPALERIDSIELQGADNQPLEARLFTPKKCKPGLIFYIHGGGFSFCDINTHERFTHCLAIESACAVLAINYRLAPEHPYPAGLNDSIALYRQLDKVRTQYPWTQGITAVAGDSSGANFALALIINQQRDTGTAPDYGMLFYGVYGRDFTTPSYRQHAEGPGLTREKMQRYLSWYQDGSDTSESLVSIDAIDDEALLKLPPLYLSAAEIDPLLSDTSILHNRLNALGRQDTLHIVPGVVHGFLQMTSRLSAANEATKHAANAFRAMAD